MIRDAQKSCQAIGNGSLYNGDFTEFIELTSTLSRDLNLRPRSYWLPYSFNQTTQQFQNIYSHTDFNSSLFAKEERQGGTSLVWDEGVNGALDIDASSSSRALCALPGHRTVTRRLQRIRGLCPGSFLDRDYAPVTSYTMSAFWMGLGIRAVSGYFIQYNRGSRKLLLAGRNGLARAEINLKSNSWLVGRHEWTIFNDTGCSNETFYVKNISFR